jgi:thiol:disulfide interchange protein
MLPFLCSIVALTTGAAAPALAQTTVGETLQQPHLAAHLVTSVDTIEPGVRFRLGVAFKIDPDWHIYAPEPGDSGLPTTITLRVPDGWHVGPLTWPEATRFEDASGVTFGYEGSVRVSATVTPPATLGDAGNVAIGADISWLVCHHNCIRGKGTLRSLVPVAGASATHGATLPLSAQETGNGPAASRPVSVVAIPPIATPRVAIDPSAADAACADVTADFAGSPRPSGLASFGLALLFAFLGGLLLNAMPCVLPVLSLKLLSLVEHAGSDRRTLWRHGLAYTAGILLSFAALTVILLSLQAGSWAFQMQSPVFVAVFVAILFAFALSLFGVFNIQLPGGNRLNARVAGAAGYGQSFSYGAFAVLLGTPCTAPFLGPAITYALAQPPVEMMALMLTVGLGVASPFLVLARFPGWRRFVPKPGPWLMTFKKIMAFMLVGAALFFLQTLSVQLSRDAFMSYLLFLAVVALAAWVFGHWSAPTRVPWTRRAGAILALVFVTFGAVGLVTTEPPEATAGTSVVDGVTWHDFASVDVEAEALAGRTVFIDFTAQWCATCKVNEAAAIHTDAVRATFEALGVLAVTADFTRYSPEVAAWLTRFDEPSVPLYVMLPAGRPADAIKLPTFPLSSDDIVRAACGARELAQTGTKLSFSVPN